MTDARYSEYFAALGEFAFVFARVERGAFIALAALAGIGMPSAAVLFSSMKVEALASNIRKLAEIAKQPCVRSQDMESLVTQLGLINRMRNLIFHQGMELSWGGGVENHKTRDVRKWLANQPDDERPLSIEILNDMTADSAAISRYLHALKSVICDGTSVEHLSLPKSWRYKEQSQGRISRRSQSSKPK